MSIDIEDFEEKSSEELEKMTNGERALRFLAENDDRAFKPAEIAEQTTVKKNTIGTVLSRLKDRNLVRHKGTYWAITDDQERLNTFTTFRQSTKTLNDQLGEEDPKEWETHAADDYPTEKRGDDK
ncbi:MarR family transcriptional regulator [Haladaptatus caseinilyticus]|uniref:MarR family transcriptional regulator n=1 Tax=Haladaptatus caseinilyticus TaxID=2993314 RepID=UPI00224B5672|nr:helix-turn-helix domain-containing protein [Haladaptatus caseinilyticus]